MTDNEFLPLTEYRRLPETEMQKRASDFFPICVDDVPYENFQINRLTVKLSKTACEHEISKQDTGKTHK